jgi:hypothetical protein
VKRTLAILLGLSSTACADELRLVQSIQETRVLGSRSEVTGAPERAWPAPGESAVVRHFVVDPGERAPLSWALGVCPRDASSSSVARCAGPVLAESVQPTPMLTEPRVGLLVPDEGSLGDVRQLLVFGILCPRGEVSVPSSLSAAWPEHLHCATPDVSGTRVETSLPLQIDNDGNRNPSLSDDEIELGDQPWADPGDPWALSPDCAGTGLLEVRAGSSDIAVRLVFTGDDREPTAAGREALSVGTFSSGGELERAFSFVESDDPANPPSVRVGWKVPGSAPAAGRLIRFHFVVRDGRGGTDWTTRALCLVP